MSYVAGDAVYRYPALGDEKPARSDAKVLLLTKGGICTTGHWKDDDFYLAWAPLPKRDHEREQQLTNLKGKQ